MVKVIAAEVNLPEEGSTGSCTEDMITSERKDRGGKEGERGEVGETEGGG